MIPPDFNAWQEEQRFKPGTRVRVIYPGEYFGRKATVLRYLPNPRIVEIASLNRQWTTMTAAVVALEVIDAPS